MNARRIGLIGAVLVALAGLTYLVLNLTIWAPVDVGTGAPAAPTLAAPQDAAATSGGAAVPATAAAPDAASDAPAPADASGSTRVYRLDPTRSEAHYEVGETFFDGNRFVVAVGRTKGVAGEIRVDTANPTASQLGEIVVDISQLASDKDKRDNYIRRRNLMSSQFPNARFVTRSIDGFPADPKMDTPLTFTISGDLTVKDVTKPVTWAVTSTLTADTLSGSATTKVKMSDYGIGPIEIPMLATEDDVLIGLDFVAVPGE